MGFNQMGHLAKLTSCPNILFFINVIEMDPKETPKTLMPLARA
jgi:hypothetical protein